MRFEIKKIISKRYVVLLLLIVIIVSAALGWFAGVRQVKVTVNGEAYHGKEAAIIENEIQENIGEITIDKLNVVLSFFKENCSLAGVNEAYLKTEEKYPGVLLLISEIYFPEESLNFEKLQTLKSVDDFEDVRKLTILASAKSSSYHYTYKETEALSAMMDQFSLPMEYGLNWLWKSFFRILNVVEFLCVFAVVLICADVFSYEKSKKMDLILESLNKSGRKTVFIDKGLMAVLIASFLYFASVILMAIMFWQLMPLPAINAPVQVVYILSVYNGTIGQALVKLILIGWLSVVTVAWITVGLNRFFSNFATIGICLVLFYLPVILSSINALPNKIYQFMSIQPINACACEKCLTSLHLYNNYGGDFVYGIDKTVEVSLFYMAISILVLSINHAIVSRKKGY